MTYRDSFADQWKNEDEIRMAYPSHYSIRYGTPYKSKSGTADLLDWIVVDDNNKEVAKHTMMVLSSKKTGKPYAVVSFRPKAKPLSPELKALLNEIAKNHGH